MRIVGANITEKKKYCQFRKDEVLASSSNKNVSRLLIKKEEEEMY